MKMEMLIVISARKAHGQAWKRGSHVGTQTKSAIAVCQSWQNAIRKEFGDRFVPEHLCGMDGVNQKIDLVDTKERVAYELKVSPNNTHMEFYRDVFKVLVFNRRNPKNKLRKLIFITPEEGAAKLRKSFTDDVRAIAFEAGLEVEVAAI
jgi:hypothetical protein